MSKTPQAKVFRQENIRQREGNRITIYTLTFYRGTVYHPAKVRGVRRIVPIDAYGLRIDAVMRRNGSQVQEMEPHDCGYICVRRKQMQELLSGLRQCKNLYQMTELVEVVEPYMQAEFDEDAKRELRRQLNKSRRNKKSRNHR